MLNSRRPLVRAGLLLAGALLAGCSANWRPLATPQPQQINEREVLEFHHSDTLVRWHAVRFTPDSVSGIPWLEHVSCDTCRVTYALATVSQPRVGNPGAGGWLILGPVLGFLGFMALITAAFAGNYT